MTSYPYGSPQWIVEQAPVLAANMRRAFVHQKAIVGSFAAAAIRADVARMCDAIDAQAAEIDRLRAELPEAWDDGWSAGYENCDHAARGSAAAPPQISDRNPFRATQ